MYSCHYQSPVCTVHFVVSVSFIIHSICFEPDRVLTTSSRSGKFGFYGVEVDEVFFSGNELGSFHADDLPCLHGAVDLAICQCSVPRL